MFQTVCPRRLSTRPVAVSLLLHSAGILILFVVSFPGSQRSLHAWRPVTLIAPTLDLPPHAPLTPAPEPPPHVVLPHRVFASQAAEAPQLRPKLVVDPPPAPVLELARAPIPEPLPVAELPHIVATAPLPTIKTGAFAAAQPGSPPPAPAVSAKASGFTSAENAAPDTGPHRLATTGGFETSSSTAAIRRDGVTHPSGFTPENAPAATNSAPPAIHSTGGFGTATVAAPTTPSSRRTTASAATVSAEILDKPRPSYTEEARRLKIEGEVLLEVRFEASGQAKVLRMLHGLGHGLDESASAAACQIRFHPAQRDGVAIDSSAVVHIVFQLAN